MSRPAVFLDRDGTLNREQGPVCTPGELAVFPAARDAVRLLDRAGWPLVVVTNQSGIALGLYDEATLARVHAVLHAALDALPRAYLHCPHHPDAPAASGYGGPCPCRKPADGLARQAATLLDLVLPGSFVIGDSARDLLLARGHGMRTVLVRTGKPWREQLAQLAAAGSPPDAVVDDVRDAAAFVLRSAPAVSAPGAPR